MDRNVERAIGDIVVIKSVIERTQRDFSRVSVFFIWIGGINLIKFVVEQISYYFRNVNGYGSEMSVFFANTSQVLPLMAYIICFMFFYRVIRLRNNSISMGLLNVWGIVLIGSELLTFIYAYLIPTGNNAAINMMWRCKELILILPIIVILLVTAIITQKKAISVLTGVYSVVYFILFTGMKEIKYGTWGGTGTRVSVSSISIRIIMTLGMIALGLYLKRGVNNGNKFNTGSISDKA